MDSNDIGKKDQYQKRLFDRLIEGRGDNQIMEMRLALPDSSSTSRVSDNSREKDRQIDELTHQLRESEESRQEVSRRLEHVRREAQQERNQQQRDIQEKDRLLHLQEVEIRRVKESTQELQKSDNYQKETILKLEQNSQNIECRKCFHDLLKKPPESKDVFHLVRQNMSADWHVLGGQLNVGMNFREGLRRESLNNEIKLEKVLIEWIGNETSDVTWEVIIKALEACRRKDVAKKITKYLEEQDTYDKYIGFDDFTPFSL